jgi:recombination protein RecT
MSEQKTETQIKKWSQQSIIERRYTMEDLVKRNMEVLQKALPKHITIDNLIGTFLTSVARNPRLLECTQTSILGSLWTAAKLGLSCDGLLGEGYLSPYKNNKKGTLECQFLPGYRGYIKLAYQSTFIKVFEARCVYENDFFDYEYGLNAKLIHRPTTSVKGKIIHVYAVVHFMNGGSTFTVMSKEEVDTIRLLSPNKDGNAWTNFYDEMAKKTICRNQVKTIPMATEQPLGLAAALDEKVEVLNESQNNELNLMDIDISGDFNEELKQSVESAETQDASNGNQKAKDAMESAKNALKNKQGNGNANGKKEISVVDELINNIKSLTSELSDAATAGDTKKVAELNKSIKKVKNEYKALTGKDYKNEF